MRVATALLAALLPTVVQAASPMQPGLWESTVSVSRAGRVPLVTTDRDCVTQREIDDGTKSLPRPGGDCQLANIATDGGKTTYDFACRDGAATLQGKAEFAMEATRYDGKLDAVARRGTNPDVPTTMTWAAKRVGDCP
jgi:Protein of unknown function (DUF3617)